MLLSLGHCCLQRYNQIKKKMEKGKPKSQSTGRIRKSSMNVRQEVQEKNFTSQKKGEGKEEGERDNKDYQPTN